MAIDATDLGALEKALNDAAGKASVLWTTFVTFELYLANAFGAVTHRQLFLEEAIKLPLLNVDLRWWPFSALNDAAGKASVLWTTFVTFELYLANAFGAVTDANFSWKRRSSRRS